MDKAGAVTVVHTFTGDDGYAPQAALVQGSDDALYGSTVVGGASGLGVLFRVEPSAATPVPPANLAQLAFSPATVRGGQVSTGSIRLTGPAPSGGAVVKLWSSVPTVASVPATVTVPAGATTASFSVSTARVKKTRAVTIEATYNGGSVSAGLTVTR
jgi:uncharacterized repeat protein (TIGR03803 family)